MAYLIGLAAILLVYEVSRLGIVRKMAASARQRMVRRAPAPARPEARMTIIYKEQPMDTSKIDALTRELGAAYDDAKAKERALADARVVVETKRQALKAAIDVSFPSAGGSQSVSPGPGHTA
jgi:hypothetical protein